DVEADRVGMCVRCLAGSRDACAAFDPKRPDAGAAVWIASFELDDTARVAEGTCQADRRVGERSVLPFIGKENEARYLLRCTGHRRHVEVGSSPAVAHHPRELDALAPHRVAFRA